MRFILVFLLHVLASFFTVAFAGVGKLTRQQESEIIEIYRSICSNNRENGQHGDTPVFCKFPKDAPKEVRGTHEVNAPGSSSTSSQIVFIRPQSNIYKHTVKLTGNSESRQNTSIFVLPQQDQHEIEIKDKRVSSSKSEKPHLYYLTQDPIADEEEQSTSESSRGLSARNVQPQVRFNRDTLLSPQNVDPNDEIVNTEITYSISHTTN